MPADVEPKAVVSGGNSAGDATRALSRSVGRRAGAIRSRCACQQSGREPQQKLRTYFFLRRQQGRTIHDVLQFFLNHRRYLRSDDPSRVGKSPAELLTGRPHAHWLELQGTPGFAKLKPQHATATR